jgi:beta-glucosidase
MKKKRIISVLLLLGGMWLSVSAQTKPIYLDETKPIEQRVEDALQRMTLDEKIA